MNLENEIGRSWDAFGSGHPVFNNAGRLEIDPPKFDLPVSQFPGQSSASVALGGMTPEQLDAAGMQMFDDLGRPIAAGLRDTVQQTLNMGGELIDYGAQKLTGKPLGAFDAVNGLIPQIQTEGIYQDIGRGAVNFVSSLLLTRGAGVKNMFSAGALADMLMDPEQGNLSSLVKEMGIETELTDFLANKVGPDADAETRLGARLKGALEGAGVGALFDVTLGALKGIKDNPELAAKILGGLTAGAVAAPEDAQGGVLDKLARQFIKADKGVINGLFKGRGATPMREAAAAEVTRVREQYPVSEGWAPMELVGGEMKDGKFEPKWRQPAYNFHKPPAGVSKEEWQGQLADKIVSDVQSVVDRAAAGDEKASFILSQASWYRDMRNRLRQEFGGMADLFADLLGTTSAQTNVRTNWDNASEIMRRFSRGEYDAEIANYERAIAAGEDPNKVFSKMRKGYEAGGMSKDEAMAAAQNDYPMLTKASGTLFGTNSPTSTGALIDTFRQIKTGASPKTPNFTGNLIGYTDEATVDVWAARYLTDLAELPRIPPASEKAVGGKHVKGSTIEDPKVGGEFGFGQAVFKDAAGKINTGNVIPGQTLGPDDLQAVAWFIEKEKWTDKGWTNKAGEGGSLDFEAARAGSSDPQRIAELRTIINADKSTPEQRALAQAEFDTLAAPVDRTIVGIAGDRPGKTLSNYGMAELAAPIDDVLRSDSNVIAYKANSTIGRFMKEDERALDTELVTRKGFDPAPLERRIIELGKEYDQDAVFISKVLRGVDHETHPNARPGVEIYFTNKQSADAVRRVTDLLNAKGIDGFTFVTDARQSDRVNVQARAGGPDTAGLTGVRFQYIPEFDDTYKATNRSKVMQEKVDLFQDIVMEMMERGDISSAQVLWYDTKVTFRDQYDGKLGATAPAGARGSEVRQGSSGGQNAPGSNSNGGPGPVSPGSLPDGKRGKP